MSPVKCFSCGKTGYISRYSRSELHRHKPKLRERVYFKAAQEKTLRASGEQPAAVKLDMESGSVLYMYDALEMREFMVRTGNDRCTLMIGITIVLPGKSY